MNLKLRPSAKKNGSKSPTTASRKVLQANGQAMPGGRYPIPNVDFLKRAVKSIGRTPPEKRPAVVAWIKKRAAALGQPQLAANLSNAADTALELAGSPVWANSTTPAVSSKDGKKVVSQAQNKLGLKSSKGVNLYAKLRKKGLPHAVAKKAAQKAEKANLDDMSNSPKA
jgi:hypothetical protein